MSKPAPAFLDASKGKPVLWAAVPVKGIYVRPFQLGLHIIQLAVCAGIAYLFYPQSPLLIAILPILFGIFLVITITWLDADARNGISYRLTEDGLFFVHDRTAQVVHFTSMAALKTIKRPRVVRHWDYFSVDLPDPQPRELIGWRSPDIPAMRLGERLELIQDPDAFLLAIENAGTESVEACGQS